MAKDYSKLIKPYETFMKNLGYQVFYNGCKPDDSEVFLVLVIPNKDNQNEFNLAFYNPYTSAPLSMDGFINRVINGDQNAKDEFAKDAINRIKGCTVSKTDVVYCLLLTQNYTIDDIYGGGNLHLTPKMLKAVSDWVNYKGGRNPLTREQVRERMNS
jgi:hypothetical protein